MNNIIIKTNRLFLRELTEEDNVSLLTLFSDPLAMKYFPSTKNIEQVDEWISKNVESYSSNGYGLYLIILKDTLEPVGYCGLILQKDVDDKDEVEIGYGLIREYWHKGYASEAAIECKKYGFEKLKIEKLISLIRPENKPSINVAIRNGMSWQKDIMRWDYLHSIYSIEQSEYIKEFESKL
jgi:RimJ/RimL family protein N-acetyltransferase